MAHNTNSKDDKLVEELKNKLEWFTFQATDEEFDPDQVRSILQLLDALDPLEASEPEDEMNFSGTASSDKKERTAEPDPAAAFHRFKEKYNISDEDLEEKDRKPDRETKIVPFHTEAAEELAFDSDMVRQSFENMGVEKQAVDAESGAELKKTAAGAEDMASQVMPVDIPSGGSNAKGGEHKWAGVHRAGVFGKAAVAAAVFFVAVTGISIAGNADPLKSFFEIVRDGPNGMKITVTGNEMESESSGLIVNNEEERIYYKSWDELEEALGVTIEKPTYITSGYELKELYSREFMAYHSCEGIYINKQDSIVFNIKVYKKDFAKDNVLVEDGWNKVNGNFDYDIECYEKNGTYRLLWIKGKSIYNLVGKDISELEEIKLNMI